MQYSAWLFFLAVLVTGERIGRHAALNTALFSYFVPPDSPENRSAGLRAARPYGSANTFMVASGAIALMSFTAVASSHCTFSGDNLSRDGCVDVWSAIS